MKSVYRKARWLGIAGAAVLLAGCSGFAVEAYEAPPRYYYKTYYEPAVYYPAAPVRYYPTHRVYYDHKDVYITKKYYHPKHRRVKMHGVKHHYPEKDAPARKAPPKEEPEMDK